MVNIFVFISKNFMDFDVCFGGDFLNLLYCWALLNKFNTSPVWSISHINCYCYQFFSCIINKITKDEVQNPI